MAEHGEGVIKFDAQHRRAALEPRRYGERACRLIAWREILARLGLVGQDPQRYGGFGYGNVSARVGPPSAPRGRRAFLITGTQTSGKACVGLADFCVVERCDARRGRVESHGLVLPSSESTTHGAIYDLGPHIRVVFHLHSPAIWRRARALRLPTSDPAVPYGSREMAREVERLYRSTALPETQILAMGGHEDGIICFGRSAGDAGRVMLRALARAYERACLDEGGLCRLS
ncbi:MAG: class II aldolase/adducin family protein [Acidobacteria bacterium]|nr:MAG: class II aldolase/adducin family protein [Acidobacteriota bacterium]